MLRLITGRIGSGKTTCIYSKIKELVETGKDVFLIVPEQYSFMAEKTMLELLGAQGADRVKVMSFSFLATSMLKKYGVSSKQLIDNSTRALMMSLTLEAVSDKLSVYSKHRYSNSVIAKMLELVKEFRQASVTTDEIRQTATLLNDTLLRSKLEEIALITDTYDSLVGASYFDDQSSLDLLCKVLDEHHDIKNTTVFIDGFRGYTAQEYKVLERIFAQSDDTYVTLCVDDAKDKEYDFSAFAHTRRTYRMLIQTANKANVPVAKPEHIEMHSQRYAGEELEILEKSIYADNIQTCENKTEHITLCSANDIESECEYVACTAKKLLRTENLRCRDIAIICRSEENYSFRIRSALRKNGIPVFDDRRQPIANQPLIELVCSSVDIAVNGFSIDSVMRVLKTGLTDLDTEEISMLENYVLMWQINGKKWLEEWTGNPDGLGESMRDRQKKELECINSYRQKIVAPLQKFRVALKDFNGLEGAEAIYKLLRDLNADENLKKLAVKLNSNGESSLAVEQSRIWDVVIEILDRIATALESTKLTAQRFADLLNLIVSTYSIGSLPQGLDEITIGSADRVKTTAPKVVFVIGMNDGVFPMIPSAGGLISESERKILAEYDLQTDDNSEEKMMEERFIAYNTLCSTCDKLYISYIRKNTNGDSMSPSEIVTQIKNIFPNITTVDTDTLDKIECIESDAYAFETMAKQTQSRSQLYSTLKEYFKDNEEYADRIDALNRSSSHEDFEIKDKELAKNLFGLNMYMSASRTEVYHKCPFEYFCKYGLNANPRKVAELDPMQKGTTIHYILENLIKIYGSDGLCKMEKSERDKCIADMLDEYFHEFLTSTDMGERFEYQYSQLTLIVCEVVDRLVNEFTVSEFEPVAFELKIDRDGEVDSYTLSLPDGGTLYLKGSVDRVDIAHGENNDFVRIVDYKSNGKKFSLNEVYSGLNMQMLIYLFAIWKNGFRDYKNLTPAGILYMPVNAPYAKVERNADSTEIEKEKQNGAKMSGMVLDDSRVVYMMDKENTGKIIPASITSSGSCKGLTITLKQMEHLMIRVEKILTDMAMNLHNGKIAVAPVAASSVSSPYHDVCKYCDYKEVCLIDKDTPRVPIYDIKHETSLIELDGDKNA